MRDSVPSVRYFRFIMYCVYGESRSSLLLESTDSMICVYIYAYIQIGRYRDRQLDRQTGRQADKQQFSGLYIDREPEILFLT